jgi:thioredoxin-related protein
MLLPSPNIWSDWLSDLQRHKRFAVVMLSRPNCPFCEAIRREQLLPLAKASPPGIDIVEFDLTSTHAFELASNPGQSVIPAPQSPKMLAQRLGIKLAPTLIFVGWRKRPIGDQNEFAELAERLVGYGSQDFFSAYLEERMALARRQIA